MRSMPTSTPAPAIDTELVGRLRLAVARLSRQLRQQGASDITPSQFSALATIENHGPITLGALASHERVQPPTMTRVVAALEEAGLVAREIDPNDRRIARVQVTADGRRFIDRSRRKRNAWIAARLRELPAEDVADLERTVRLLEHLLEGRP
jgi:DNA-binding MarR family transcriptional regulator